MAFTEWLISLIQTHGILAVILGVVIETIVVPIPSPMILMAAGFILIPAQTLSQAFLQSLWIAAVAGLAQTIGSYFVYGIAYYGGKPIIDKYEKWHGVSWKDISTFQKKFQKKGRETLTLGVMRALPIMPLSVISGVAGILKMDFKRYTLATLAGVIPRNVFLALLGWQLKSAYAALAGVIDKMETVMPIAI